MLTGQQLRAFRGYMDLTRKELAVLAKISPETIKNWENQVFRPSSPVHDAVMEIINRSGLRLVDGGIQRAPVCHHCNQTT